MISPPGSAENANLAGASGADTAIADLRCTRDGRPATLTRDSAGFDFQIEDNGAY